MLKGLLGKKIGMSQMYTEAGEFMPVTLIQAGPCNLMQIKTVENDGYTAVQLGFSEKKKKRATKPEIGHAAKASLGPRKFVREIEPEENATLEVGGVVTVDIFKDVKKINVIGISKGKGFAGVMKRWNMRGGPKTHGSTRHRAPGSIGAGSDPGRVVRGKKMAGRLGGERVTVKNLDVVRIDSERNLLVVKGAVPGHKDGYLIIKK